MNYLEYDRHHIFEEQKATFRLLFNEIDLSKICFVGGVADYLNLRDYYDMPVHDLDVVYQDEADLEPLKKYIEMERYHCKFYEFDEMEVLVGQHFINNKRVHIDFFRRNFIYGGVTTSMLLGREVRHSTFESMKKFHNDHIGKLTSRAMGVDYEWKRLYKHSKKASLYNLVTYQQEKQSKELMYERA